MEPTVAWCSAASGSIKTATRGLGYFQSPYPVNALRRQPALSRTEAEWHIVGGPVDIKSKPGPDHRFAVWKHIDEKSLARGFRVNQAPSIPALIGMGSSLLQP